ncbi:MAG TPA: DnaB-like helicase C-terminal domain-containing protein, partial [Anaerovoracaceae bacterium]|nr:DnaB-like helicase C-terminal domain-containing protein [Anaerovoracaceae bacterium]
DPLAASEFANTYDESLFVGDAKVFAKSILGYIKAYKSTPTKRVLLDHYSASPDAQAEINEIWDAVQGTEATSAEFRYDLDKVKGRFATDKILSLKAMLDDPPSDLALTVKSFQKELDEIKRVQQSRKQAYTQKSLKQYSAEFKRQYNDKFRNKDLGRGILTGYSFLDYVKNGMMPAEMMIIGGETGAGKSMLLNNMAIQMWMQKNTVFSTDFVKGCNVLYFSLEMPYDACFRRTMARVADIPMYSIRDASLNANEMEAMRRSLEFIERYPYEFEIVDIPRGVTVEQIENRFQEAMTRYHPDVVVVDYLGLLEDADAEGDDWLKLGYIAGKLHEFARVYNIVVLTAVQLNRMASKANASTSDKIGMHRIGRSSLIMHHANVGIQLESRPNEKDFAWIPYHVIKNRDGEMGEHQLVKNFKNATLKDCDTPYEPKEDIDSASPAEIDDISELLDKYEWGKT